MNRQPHEHVELELLFKISRARVITVSLKLSDDGLAFSQVLLATSGVCKRSVNNNDHEVTTGKFTIIVSIEFSVC